MFEYISKYLTKYALDIMMDIELEKSEKRISKSEKVASCDCENLLPRKKCKEYL
ncbi:hypothetical protein [Anaeromicrobium sediminis]|uniref:hypothetical protein n=1 Tax=Anaeromicrobium sediminis TaxID=1478221 RepID=UPI001595B3E6|nr:hypothetical protein [Anaeromicrobium sediminis]